MKVTSAGPETDYKDGFYLFKNTTCLKRAHLIGHLSDLYVQVYSKAVNILVHAIVRPCLVLCLSVLQMHVPYVG